MINLLRCRHSVGFMVMVLAFSLALSSCTPLRKKFTRQKKKGQVEDTSFIPVLEPQEYPAPEQNPPANYREHYALIKVWYKDLWAVLDDKNSDKKARYTIGQVLSHIVEMQKLVVPEKQAELIQLADLLKYFESSLDSPEALRNKSRIQSDLRAFDRLLRNQLRADKLEGFFVKAVQ